MKEGDERLAGPPLVSFRFGRGFKPWACDGLPSLPGRAGPLFVPWQAGRLWECGGMVQEEITKKLGNMFHLHFFGFWYSLLSHTNVFRYFLFSEGFGAVADAQ